MQVKAQFSEGQRLYFFGLQQRILQFASTNLNSFWSQLDQHLDILKRLPYVWTSWKDFYLAGLHYIF